MHMTRTHVPFQSIWKMGIDHPYSLWLADGAVAWSCGQCPLDADGAVIAPGDLAAQGRFVADLITRTLGTGAITPTQICKLVVYYVPDAAAPGMLAQMARHFGSGVVTVPVAVPHFYYEGMLIEVDVFSSTQQPRHWNSANTGEHASIELVDGGELIHAKVTVDGRALGAHSGGWQAIKACLGAELARCGLTRDHLLADYWFVGTDAASDFLRAATAEGYCSDPGAAALCDWESSAAVVGDLIFVRDESAAVDKANDSEGLRLRRRGRFFHVSARRSGAASLIQQTASNMGAVRRALRAEGLGFENVCKATTLYAGGSEPAELHDNMSVRNSHYEEPGPASTGLPVLRFPFSGSLITVDVIGTVPKP